MGRKATEWTEMDTLFSMIYSKIAEQGSTVEITNDQQLSKMPVSCYELERMVALSREDGTRELGVRSDGMILLGMFPKMNRKGRLNITPERLAYYQSNLQYYQARLKL